MGFHPGAAEFQGSLSDGVLGGEKVLLAKPETFMNLSGQTVGEVMRFYKLTPSDITVFHDELDLAPGQMPCENRWRARRSQWLAVDPPAYRALTTIACD